VEDHVVGIERVDRGDQLRFVRGPEVRDLVEQVQRAGDETEVLPLVPRIELSIELRDAVRQRLVAAEEVVEVFVDRRVDRVADGGGPGVEIDEDRLTVSRKGE